jgi:hypothetical protein
MTIMKRNVVDSIVTLFNQLLRELMRWTTSQTKMLMGIIKVDPKKNVYHSTLIIEILMQHFFPKTNNKYSQKLH